MERIATAFAPGRAGAWALASLTLGLAPFVPEPHVWGKLRWVAGGAVGMGPMDWFDLCLHGTPWVGLAATLGMVAWRRARQPMGADT